MAAMGFSSQTCAPFRKPSPFQPPYFCFCKSFSYSTSRFSWAASRLLLNRYKCSEAIAIDVPFSIAPDLGNSLEKESSHRSRLSNPVYQLRFETDSESQYSSMSRLSLNQQLPPARKVSLTRDRYPARATALHRSWFEETDRLGKKKQDYYKQKNGSTCQSTQVGRNSDFELTPDSHSTSTCFPSDPLIADFSPADNNVSSLSLEMRVEEQERSISIADGDHDDRDKRSEAIATDVPFSVAPDLGNSLEKESSHRSRLSNTVYQLRFETDSESQYSSMPRLSLNQQLPPARKVSSTRNRYPTRATALHRSWFEETDCLGKKKQDYCKQKNGSTCQSMQVGRNSDFKLTPNSHSTSTCFPSDPLIADLSPADNNVSSLSLELRVEEQERSISIADGDHDDSVVKKFPNFEEFAETSGTEDAESRLVRMTEGEGSQLHLRERLGMVYEKVHVVDSISLANEVVSKLTSQYKHLVHACDTEVASIDVKLETPVDHGEIICFSIYCGPDADFGNGKSCIWVDVLQGGGKEIMEAFAPFFASPEIKKVWHNYSFDNHIIENYGLKLAGFHADTMHMARLWDSSRRTGGGYSLEALTGSSSLMSGTRLCPGEELIGKVSMKTIFGRKKLKKDGSDGKILIIPSVEDLQTTERKLWICYSALDSISTLRLYESLEMKLSKMKWELDGVKKGTMYNFYEEYWRPFGELLVRMETQGMQVDRAYLAEIEKVAIKEQQIAADKFRSWASKYCPDAKLMNVGSDTQLRQLFFGGIQNAKNPYEDIPVSKEFKVPNVDLVIEEGKKAPKKYRTITLHRIFDNPLKTDMYTPSGWPSICGDALKALARQCAEEAKQLTASDAKKGVNETASYETEGEVLLGASYAISALCEVCSIDSLISNFILPLQGPHIAGKNQRIHCSLNINTETGRLSARRPNLQNQPALEKDRYKIRQAFIAEPGNSLIVADYGQLELRILAHLANCQSMLDAFKAGGDFHSRTAMNMYPHIRQAIEQQEVLLEWYPQPGEDKPPVPLLKDAFASERRKAKMLNFSIAYGKTPVGLARDWKVSVEEAEKTVNLWYSDRKEVLAWQEERKAEARAKNSVHTLLGRARLFPSQRLASRAQTSHIDRAAINTPVQGSAADVAMCAMLQISENPRLEELGWKLLLQVHDEVILEGPTESAEIAKDIVVECMSKPFNGKNILKVDLAVDAKCAKNWYAAK